MLFNELVNDLKSKLDLPLPGYEAQKLMAPILTSGERFNHYEGQAAKNGAVLILFYPSDGQIQFPLIQRPDYNGVHSGQVALPGGKKDETDRDLIHTALREANEEIGVDDRDITVIGSLTELYVQVSNIKVLPVVGFMEKKPEFIPDYREVEEVLTVNLNHLLDENNHSISDIEVGGNIRLKAPFFDLNRKVVWGATAMILSELVTVFNK